uniref:Uncharacterized protein n=2 Tax=Clytia hemisphaerica TaxID=252671 RepID=A0A7M5V9S0_9CNID
SQTNNMSSVETQQVDVTEASSPIQEENGDAPPKRKAENSDVGPEKKLQRFELIEENAKAWELAEDQAVYVNKYLSKHLNQKELKERVLDEYPPPINMKTVPILDTHIKEILQENGKFDALHIDKTLKTVQDNLMTVFGPICYVWSNLEHARREALEAGEEDDYEEPCRLFDKGIILLAQTFNNISYQRRLALLSKLISSQPAVKEILKTQSETLDNPGNSSLFGPSFDETLAKDISVRGKAKSAFTALKNENAKPAPSGTRRGRGGGYPRGRASHMSRGTGFRNFGKRWPFRGGPRLQGSSGRGRGQSSTWQNQQQPQYRGGYTNRGTYNGFS